MRRILICFFLFFGDFGLFAQLDESLAPREFQVYLWPGGPNTNMESRVKKERSLQKGPEDEYMVRYIPPTIQYSPSGGEDVKNIKAAERRLSPVYPYFGHNPLQFFSEEVSSGGQIERRFLGEVSVPLSYKRALLLFLPDPTDSRIFRIYPIENSQTKIKPGEASLHNLTGERIACLFDSQQMLLEPLESRVCSIEGRDRVYVVVRIGSEGDSGKWRERYSRQIFVSQQESLTVLIYGEGDNADSFKIIVIRNPEDEAVDSGS
ncbi:MAG: hypothetical protein ACQKBT_11760 [Puniceicoccales bacterium]